MATITLTIPDAQLTRVITAVCAINNYTAASGMTQAQYAKSVLAVSLKNMVTAYESGISTKAAAAQTQADVNANVVIT